VANIQGIAGTSPQEITFELNRGGKFVDTDTAFRH